MLCIYTWYEGEWCYGPETATALSQSLSLRNLSIAGRSVGTAWAEAKLSLPRTNKVIKVCNVGESYSHPENAVSILFSYLSQKHRFCFFPFSLDILEEKNEETHFFFLASQIDHIFKWEISKPISRPRTNVYIKKK